MKIRFFYSSECMIYPGGYFVLPEVEELVAELKFHDLDSNGSSFIKIVDLVDSYKIEAALPGIHREDIFILVNENILSLVILHRKSAVLKKALKIKKFKTDYFERHLILPYNADTEFGCAEYKKNVLSIYLSKTDDLAKRHVKQIVVY